MGEVAEVVCEAVVWRMSSRSSQGVKKEEAMRSRMWQEQIERKRRLKRAWSKDRGGARLERFNE